ncbi:hypothetical protein RIF29_15687 [Crotalaria pallida]|uniref:Uncharacterized protein n=1 Tax=Crotalaria pallida TaxID=3830 RepID=A0AAN9FHL2_CROPI
MLTGKRRQDPASWVQLMQLGLAELVSTIIFVFAASGSVIAFNKITTVNRTATVTLKILLSTAVAHAFAFLGAVSISAKMSGGFVNPAITFGLFLGGNISIFRVFTFWLAQILGSIVACLLLWLATGVKSIPSFGIWVGAEDKNAMLWEAVMTFGLVYTVYATAIDLEKRKKGRFGRNVGKGREIIHLEKIAPLAIGFIVGANILAGGISINPAVSIGSAVVSWSWANHGVYWLGPFIGGGLAGFLYEMFWVSQANINEQEQPLLATHYRD